MAQIDLALVSNPSNRTYRCSEGDIAVAVTTAEQWRGLAVSIGRPELAYEGDWEAVRKAAGDGPIAKVVAEHFAEDTATAWKRRLDANGVPCTVP